MAKKTAKATQPIQLKAWDRRPWPSRGTRSLDKVYASVGRALSQWERHEEVLSRIFTAFVSDGHSIPAQRAYNAVRTFEGRAEMLRAASGSFFAIWPDTSLQNDFKNILRSAMSYSPRRNDIAHGVVDRFRLKEFWRPAFGSKPKASFALYPTSASFKERDIAGVPSYCYASPELDYFSAEFAKLLQPAMTFGVALVHRRFELQASREREIERLRASTSHKRSEAVQQ